MSQSLKCEYNKELFANVELLFVDMCVHIDSVKIFKYRSNYLSSLLVVKFPVACFSFRGSMSDKKSHMVCIFPRKMLKPWFLKKKKKLQDDLSFVPMAAAFTEGELTGVDRIIPGVLRVFLLTSASKDTREGHPEHPERQ